MFFFKYIFIIAGLVKNKRLGTWSPHTSFCMKMNGIMYLSQCYLYWGFIYFALLIITFSYISESLCPLFFFKFLFLTKWQPFQNYEKCFSFHLKSSFHSQDIQIFVFLSSPLFLPVSHCFRGWSKINLKVYDIINCLNKNLIRHFVWYLGKEKRYGIEILSFDRVCIKEKSCRKCAPKAIPRPLFSFGK